MNTALDREKILQLLALHRGVVLVAAGFLISTSWLSMHLPVFVSPNEELHYEYVALIHRTGALPNSLESQRADERHQPPLYYTLSALAGTRIDNPVLDTELDGNPHYLGTRIGNRNPKVVTNPAKVPLLLVSRRVSSLFGVMGLILFYIASRTTLSCTSSILAVVLLAFHPMYLFLSSTANNDLPIAALMAAIIAPLSVVLGRKASYRVYLSTGVVFGLAALTKASAVFGLPQVVAAIFLVSPKHGRLAWALRKLSIVAIAAAPAVIFLVRLNYRQGMDAIGASKSVPIGALISADMLDFRPILPHVYDLWRSFQFDWSRGGAGYTTDVYYLGIAVLYLIGVSGFVLATMRHRKISHLIAYCIGPAGLILFFLRTKTLMAESEGFIVPEGRWILPALAAIAWLVATGWEWLCERANWGSGTLVLAGLYVVSSLLAGWITIDKHYSEIDPSQMTESNSGASTAATVYGGLLSLGEPKVPDMIIGKTYSVPLHWRATNMIDSNYSVSVQVLGGLPGLWEKLDEQNSYPGNGLNPTRSWRPDAVYRDKVVVEPNGVLNGPTVASLGVWVISDLSRELTLSATRSGKQVHPPIVAKFVIRPADSISAPQHARLTKPVTYSDMLALTGATAAKSETNSFEVSLWWSSLARAEHSYSVFVHALDQSGQILQQSDNQPNQGNSPTSIWEPGDTVLDIHDLGNQFSGQVHTLLVGVYDTGTMQRLEARQDGLRLLHDSFAFRPSISLNQDSRSNQ